MAEKNYTEYEREQRDFEKKPLAKDRETLIFPPQSDIKKSEDQEASVLPAAPKLSMRKKAGTWDLPFTVGKAQRLQEIVSEYEEEEEIDTEALQNELTNIFGDDELFDDLSDARDGKHAAELIKARLGYFLSDYEEDPENFRDKLEAPAKEILVGIVTASIKSPKKIAVNDKILTSSKKKAKVVKVSDDLIFWVSIDGEKDFGSDFVDEVELFEEHEPHEPFERHRRERGEPIDSGLTKEVPLEETIELANKNKRKKKAGTWSLPFTEEKASELSAFVEEIETEGFRYVEDKLYSLYGDDKLFDAIYSLFKPLELQVAKIIKSAIKDLLDDYETNPENFKEELDPAAKEILERI